MPLLAQSTFGPLFSPLLAHRLLAQSTFGPYHFWPVPLLAFRLLARLLAQTGIALRDLANFPFCFLFFQFLLCCCVVVLLCCGVVVLWCCGVVVLWCCGVVVLWCCGVVVLWCCGVVVLWCCGVLWGVSCGVEGCSISWVRPRFGCSLGLLLSLTRTSPPKKKNNYNYNYNCSYMYNRNDNCNYICRCHNQCQLWEGTRVLTFWKVTGCPTLLGGGDRSGGFGAGFHTTAREFQTCTFEGPGASNTTKIPRKDPQEREERVNICGGEGKKARNFGPPTLRGPTPRGPIFSSFGLHPSWPPPFGASTCLPTTDAPRTHFFQFLLVSCVVFP